MVPRVVGIQSSAYAQMLSGAVMATRPKLTYAANKDSETFEACEQGALASLRQLVEASRIDLPEHLPPMAAGLVGYLGYDTVALMEDIPSTRPDVLGTPDGLFIRPTIMAIFDLVKDTVIIVTPIRYDQSITPQVAFDAAREPASRSRRRF